MIEKNDIETLSDLFQALSDPNRLKILELLRTSPHSLCVNALAQNLGISQSAVSQHLKILRQNGLVNVRKEGNFKHYAVSLENLKSFRSMRESLLGKDFKI